MGIDVGKIPVSRTVKNGLTKFKLGIQNNTLFNLFLNQGIMINGLKGLSCSSYSVCAKKMF